MSASGSLAEHASPAAQGADELVLAIDGGGSKTVVLLVDRHGQVRDEARGPGINPMDNPAWRQNLQQALSGINAPSPRAIVAAMPAYGEVAELSTEQERLVAAIGGGAKRQVINDVDAAHIGAFSGKAGILILAGTGSMAWARDGQGGSHRVGGWGDIVGDEGSAYWMGLRLLSSVSKCIDGRLPSSGLVKVLFDKLNLDLADAANALEGWATQLKHPRSEIAALAPLTTAVAASGDELASLLVDQTAEELALHVRAIAARAGSDLDWSYAGGVLDDPTIRSALTRHIGGEPVSPVLPPIGGAVLAAAGIAGWKTDTEFIENLRAALQSLSGARRDAKSYQEWLRK